MRKHELILVREGMRPSDEPMVYAIWLHALRHGNSEFLKADQDAFFKTYHEVIKTILERPSTIVRIACLKDDEDTNLGFSVFEPQTLHWVFVKPGWRGLGLMHDLVPKDTQTVTHMTRIGRKLLPEHVKYNPFL